MNRTRLGVAVVGAGRAGMVHARNLASGIEGARLVALVDPDETALAVALRDLGVEKGYRAYQQALEDREVDAVVVVAPTVYHREIVEAAAGRKRHVFCEKPMAMNAGECRAMIAACDSAGVVLQIGFVRRFDEGFLQAKQAVDDGRIGEVVLIKSLTRGPSVPRPWMYDIAKSNGPLAEVNSHDIDTMRWFAGSNATEVYAIAGNYRCPDARADHPDFYDNVVMSVRLADGKQAVIDGAVSVGYAYDARLEVLGTRGVLFAGRLSDSSVAVYTAGNGCSRPVVKSWRRLFLDAYRQELASFVEAIREEKPPLVTGTDGMEAVKVVNAGNLSITERRPVAVV